MVTSGVVANWAVWGMFAFVGSFFFLIGTGRKR
jgi:hypothetical protein